MERAIINVKGRVQRAGYRDFIDETAFNLDLTGSVKNMEDGSVEVVCEGPKDKIQELVKKIQIKQYPIKVESIDVKYSKAKGDFKAFEIVRDEDLTTAVYDRMDTAARYMREMNQNLGGKMDSGFSEVNHSVTNSISSLDNHICNNFDHLDKKYDKISDRMERMDKTLEKLADAILLLAKK
jgi:acylphosphatase